MSKKEYVFVLDVDGTATDGKMYYSDQGKLLKAFGPDDWDVLKQIQKFVDVSFITADKKGYRISSKRIRDDVDFPLMLVSGEPEKRWEEIEKRFFNKKIIFMGDGWADWLPIQRSDYGITTCDALDHVKQYADYVTARPGGNRAIAEACLYLMQDFLRDICDDWILKNLHPSLEVNPRKYARETDKLAKKYGYSDRFKVYEEVAKGQYSELYGTALEVEFKSRKWLLGE